jgi:hypothetical protein
MAIQNYAIEQIVNIQSEGVGIPSVNCMQAISSFSDHYFVEENSISSSSFINISAAAIQS